MKPRRENGATFVSPMTSDVSWVSARIMDFLRRVREAHSANKRRRKQITSLRGSQHWVDRERHRYFGREKEQGRRRSIPPTALPAPDIEIGLRHPVNCTLPRESTAVCDPVHNRHNKVAAGPWEGINRIMALILPHLF